MKKSLSVLALLLSLSVILSLGSLAAFAAESGDASGEASAELSADASGEASADVSEDASSDASADASEDASSDASADASEDASADASEDASSEESAGAAGSTDTKSGGGSFPWALVIFSVIVVAAVIACVICIKLQNRFGLWLKNFFKDHKSELKKVTWPSREVTVKNTVVVLVCLVVSGVAVGLLDFGLAKLVELLKDLVS